MIISTHLIEEVSGFISRAVLIKDGRVIGDESIDALENSGKDLVSYVKESYGYKEDRVARALSEITGDGE